MVRTLLCWLEGALLAVLGVGMIELSLSAVYWQFLNPRFVPLTVAGGVVCVVLAVAHPFGGRAPRLSSLLSLAGFLLVAGLALYSVKAQQPSEYALNGFDPGPPPESVNFSEAPAPEPSRMTLGGQEYLRLNLMELWLLLEENGGAPERFVLQGQVLSLPGQEGRFGVARVAVVCCLADAVAVGFEVDAPLPEDVQEGDWVRVAGRVAPLSGAKVAFGEAALPGVTMTVFQEQFMLEPEDVAPIPRPEIPFVFEFRPEEPFAY